MDQSKPADVANRGRELQRVDEQIALVAYKLRLAARRDAIAATRPEGCFCLGEGGEDMGAFGIDQDRTTFGRYCQCPEGKAARQADVDYMRERLSTYRAQAMDAIMGAAGIPLEYEGSRFDNFPLKPGNTDAHADVQFWECGPNCGPAVDTTDPRWTAWQKLRKYGLLIFGPNGSGKTSLAAACAHHRVSVQPIVLRFVVVPDLLAEIRGTFNRGAETTEARILDDLFRADLLILDDIAAKAPSDWAYEELFRIINRRYSDRKETIYTADRSPDELTAQLGARIASRILGSCYQVSLDGAPNLRYLEDRI